MNLNVTINGLTFNVPCGEGGQTFKWLGFVAAQRYGLLMPHGRSRTREDSHALNGFFLPVQVSRKSTGEVLHPGNQIKEHCQDKEHIQVNIQDEVSLDEAGTPNMPAWAVEAFYHNKDTKSKLMKDPEIEASVQQLNETRDADEVTFEEKMKVYEQETQLKKTMTRNFTSQKELEAAIEYDWRNIKYDDLEPQKAAQGNLRDVVEEHFVTINAIFLHYAAGSIGEVYCMSFEEYAHFIHETTLFHSQNDFKILEETFEKANEEKYKDPSNPKFALKRYEFIECLLRLVFVRNTIKKEFKDLKFAAIFKRVFVEVIKPTIERLTTGPFRDITHNELTVTLLHEQKARLVKVFKNYALRDSEKSDLSSSSNTISVTQIHQLIRDCGLLCRGNSKEQQQIVKTAIENAFVGVKEASDSSVVRLVYAEFVEAIARISLEVWANEGLSPQEVLVIAFDAMRPFAA